ncbi:efflux RND transporter periplasmic adaptor subunit [Pseudomonas sp. PIC25]|uniref:efflux RND transporter periplasmic adaptor subunit n=1 Tax=Pseudomonas sp. PIC25 TaxID=1958773 RepID=UPI00267F5000
MGMVAQGGRMGSCKGQPVRFFASLKRKSRKPGGPRSCSARRLAVTTWLQAFLACCCLGSISPTYAFNCLIEPNQTVDLGTPITGLLAQVLVSRADRISEGQVLAHLESNAEIAATELARFKSEQVGPTQLAKSKIEFAQRKFGRLQAMAEENLMPAQQSDDAEAELRLAEAELKVASENRQLAKLEHQQQRSLLALRTIRSPFNGVVVEQLAFAGEVVEPGAGKRGILRVAQLDPLRVQVVMPKTTFGQIHTGMKVDVIPELSSKERYVAQVRSVDRLLNAASGTFVVLLELPNPNLEIPAGVTCTARFPAPVGEGGASPP